MSHSDNSMVDRFTSSYESVEHRIHPLMLCHHHQDSFSLRSHTLKEELYLVVDEHEVRTMFPIEKVAVT